MTVVMYSTHLESHTFVHIKILYAPTSQSSFKNRVKICSSVTARLFEDEEDRRRIGEAT